MKNCLASCQYYNETVNACNAPKAENFITFNADKTKDCPMYKYKACEDSEVNDEIFVNKFCKGLECPIYHEKLNICTKPSVCPYKKYEQNNIISFKI